jgi:hypothetical protein
MVRVLRRSQINLLERDDELLVFLVDLPFAFVGYDGPAQLRAGE